VAELTSTSYAVLGLLSIQPWTTYELAKQMEVSLHNFWPRAERKLYEEPKKLVEYGLAEVSEESTGRRRRRVYRITPDGRRALRAWLDTPGAMPTLEFEALVQVFLAEQGSKQQLVNTLNSVRAEAERRQGIDARWASHYLASGGRFPQRLPVITLVGALQHELNRTLSQWAAWALQTVEKWPDDIADAPAPRARLRQIAAGADVGEDARVPPPGYGQDGAASRTAPARPST
jgi:DNA-binding PadR family transcriptional regulator